nr:uncharacterized protein LOC131280896 [Dasypus novemcinctus]
MRLDINLDSWRNSDIVREKASGRSQKPEVNGTQKRKERTSPCNARQGYKPRQPKDHRQPAPECSGLPADSAALLMPWFWTSHSLKTEPKEAWGAPGVENPSFNKTGISWSSICSFTDDLGYQASQDLSSEEEPSFSLSKRRKRSKASTVRVQRHGAKEEDDEDEKDEDEGKAKGSPTSSRAPRSIQKRCPHSRTRQLEHKEHLRVLESSLSMSTAEVKLSRWSLARLCDYLCSCCHRRQKAVEENKTPGSRERRSPREPGSGWTRAQRGSLGNSKERSGQKPEEKA